MGISKSLSKFFPQQNLNKPTKKILLTFFLLFLFKFGTSIPLEGIDNEALKKSFLQIDKNNSLFQIISMYSGTGGKTLLSPFSLGIIPFINASILIDLLAAVLPSLEKLQSDESGRKQLTFYKKVVTFFLAFVQSYFLISSLKSYFYFNDLLNFFILAFQLVTGSLIMVWLTTIIDSKGVGNGTSLIIFTNIVTSLLNKNLFKNINILEIFFIFLLIGLICISQMAKIPIPIVSARQLAFLETNKKNKMSTDIELKNSTLLIRFNQAGIFPLIIAANLIPIFTYLNQFIFQNIGNQIFSSLFENLSSFFPLIFIYKFIQQGSYYFLIILFNYFYTFVFWDPEKISEQLRKASVSIINVTPGKQTISYLKNVVTSSSIIGGIFLSFILYLYDFLKQILNSYFLGQINISSLIILVGVAFEIQKILRGMYKTLP